MVGLDFGKNRKPKYSQGRVIDTQTVNVVNGQLSSGSVFVTTNDTQSSLYIIDYSLRFNIIDVNGSGLWYDATDYSFLQIWDSPNQFSNISPSSNQVMLTGHKQQMAGTTVWNRGANGYQYSYTVAAGHAISLVTLPCIIYLDFQFWFYFQEEDTW